MANKKSLLGGSQIKVGNMSGFDKSRFNAFTAPLGAIVPMVSQLMLPGRGKLSVKLSAQLPPLASDAFLRTHLKVEAFLCPMRLCYGGFDSWYSGKEIAEYDSQTSTYVFKRAKLPRIKFTGTASPTTAALDKFLGPHSLLDYLGCKAEIVSGHPAGVPGNQEYLNIFPALCYDLIYDNWYRNKLIEKPLFSPADYSVTSSGKYAHIPYVAFSSLFDVPINLSSGSAASLANGSFIDLRYRNYGYDYFTTALPSAQEGNPMSVDTSGGSFTISSLRLQNSLQHFSEVNQLAGPDMVQTNKARYGVDLSDGVAQRPILLGSADFPMFTSGVEQTAQGSGTGTTNPFGGIAARYGRAHAEGSDFVCEFNCKEPSYLMVLCSLVPEANYSAGLDHDLMNFTADGSLVDLPVSMLENTGYEPIYEHELCGNTQIGPNNVFGYQPRYMWHKAGAVNQVHGLFRLGSSLASFVPQRDFYQSSGLTISTAFLKVDPSDLDSVMAVNGSLSQYGVMVDSAISLFVSEPLGESVLPSLVDPAYEHGYSVYVKRGGSALE